MLGERIAVGHASDEIGDAPRPRGVVEAREPLLPLLRQVGGMRAVTREQVAHHAGRLVHHAHDARMAIHMRLEEGFDSAIRLPHVRREAGNGRGGITYVIRRARAEPGKPPAGLGDDVIDEETDELPDQLMDKPMFVKARIGRTDAADDPAGQRHGGDIVDMKQRGAQAVVEVMGVVGDIVGEGGDLCLDAGEAP